MGADIYLRSVSDKASEKYRPLFEEAVKRRNKASQQGDVSAEKEAQQEVNKYYDAMNPDDGYFRDSYNSTSLFWILGLSWWGTEYDENGCLPIETAKKLREQIANANLNNEEFQSKFGGRVKAEDYSSTEEWLEYFEKKRENFLKLLDKSIELNEPLYCSV